MSSCNISQNIYIFCKSAKTVHFSRFSDIKQDIPQETRAYTGAEGPGNSLEMDNVLEPTTQEPLLVA